MLKRPCDSRPLIFRAIIIFVGAATVTQAQPTSPTRAASPMGTYAFGTRHLPHSSNGDGCWLEAAPVTADSMHVQILCRNPAPGHHLGVLDARLWRDGDKLVYDRGDSTDHCRIRIRFAANRALVVQDGTDRACGFGAFVNVSGTYVRLNKRRPPFDLVPIGPFTGNGMTLEKYCEALESSRRGSAAPSRPRVV